MHGVHVFIVGPDSQGGQSVGQASWQKVFQVWASLGSIVASVIRPVPGEAAPAEAQPCRE